jgi:RHS repeat-associated protein
MRIKKVEGLLIYWNPEDEVEGSGFYDEITQVDKPTVRYYYDGQMCIEEDSTENLQQMGQGPLVTVTRYAVGARGIDWMWKKVGSGTPVVAFPIYDGHGNMVATLGRSGSSSYAVGDIRTYDAWGNVRSGATSGDPNPRYCANLGHKQDDETDLIYMRARYYEPWTGRFVSEDHARDGWNWYVYCRNNPLSYVDANGNNPISIFLIFLASAALLNTLVFLLPALYSFAQALTTASNGLQVEELWAEFMDVFTGKSELIPPEGSILARIIGTALALASETYRWTYYVGLAVTAANVGIRGSLLCYAYQLRVAWYLDDIDRF